MTANEIFGATFSPRGSSTVDGPPWLANLRQCAREQFEATGLPRRKVENWRYTDLTDLGAQAWEPAQATSAPSELSAEIAGTGPRLTLFNGRFVPQLSNLDGLSDGARLMGLADCLAAEPTLIDRHLGKLAVGEAMPLAALNTAWIDDGAVLIIAPGAKIDQRLHIVSLGDGDRAAFHPRLLVVAGDGCSVTLVEHHLPVQDHAYFSNSVAEIFVGSGARLEHIKIQEEAMSATHLAAAHIRLDDEGSYEGFILQKGARLARHEIAAELGAAADCRVAAAYLGNGDQHLDTTIRIEHVRPGATSRQHVRGVLTDQARGVFQGKTTVHKGAQQTDGQQMSRALLLSPEARFSAKPELEIYADDVKCGHGATTGALSEDAMFYLEARGIDRETARALLIGAFVEEVIAEISDAPSRTALRALVGKWLFDLTGHDWSIDLDDGDLA